MSESETQDHDPDDDRFFGELRMPDERETDQLEAPDETLPVEWVDPDDIQPNDWNPNNMYQSKREELVFSIRDNGWTQPLVVDSDSGRIIDGEQRYSILNHVVMTTDGPYEVAEDEDITPDGVPAGYVPVFETTMTELQQRVATRQHNIAGDHDIDQLGNIIADLEDEGVGREAAQHMNIDPPNYERLLDRADVMGESPPPEEVFDIPWVEDEDDREMVDDGEGGEKRADPVVGGEDGPTGADVKRIDLLITEEEMEDVEYVLTEDLRTDWFVRMCELAIDEGMAEELRVGPHPDETDMEVGGKHE